MGDITLRFVTDSYKFGSRKMRERTYKYKTLDKARGRAASLVTNKPKLDPDGYAVHPAKGDCLFFNGVTAKELFPGLMPK
jgi:hypothetical protein